LLIDPQLQVAALGPLWLADHPIAL
jgi:hypothetical protein